MVVWFVALRGSSSNSEPTATTPVHSASPSTASSSGGGSSAGSGSVYHGSAPGVEGLTRDLQKAHGAVAQSERNAAKLEHKAARASAEGTAAVSGGTSASGTSTKHSSAASSSATASKPAAKSSHKTAARKLAAAGLSGQAWVEHEIAKKVTVALLFYSPHSYDDSRTRRELQRLIGEERSRHVKIVLRVASAKQVGAFGQFTRVASIYQTPTVLLVTPGGVVKEPITGLTDAYSLEQAIDEKSKT
ncbi:MAG TPA: hypothetical protein VFO24_04840 [Usitatibacter sp.]|nr:hypothetical protein [Usitatibacter sp.]